VCVLVCFVLLCSAACDAPPQSGAQTRTWVAACGTRRRALSVARRGRRGPRDVRERRHSVGAGGQLARRAAGACYCRHHPASMQRGSGAQLAGAAAIASARRRLRHAAREAQADGERDAGASHAQRQRAGALRHATHWHTRPPMQRATGCSSHQAIRATAHGCRGGRARTRHTTRISQQVRTHTARARAHVPWERPCCGRVDTRAHSCHPRLRAPQSKCAPILPLTHSTTSSGGRRRRRSSSRGDPSSGCGQRSHCRRRHLLLLSRRRRRHHLSGRRAGAARGAAWTPSGCCSRTACARPPAACPRR
jgi:hypothetical protein